MSVRVATLIGIIGVALSGVLAFYGIADNWMRISADNLKQGAVWVRENHRTFFEVEGRWLAEEFFLIAGLLTFLIVLFIKQKERSK